MDGDRQDAIIGTPEERRRQGELPATREAASKLVKAAYDASHIADEGRFPVTCLMCYPVAAVHDIHMQFSEPRPANAKEIAKLTHAIDNQSHIACIAQPDGISLNGFHVNMLLNQREYGYFSGHIGNPLKVRIKGPGHIEVSCAGMPLVLREGQITEESPLTYSSSMGRLVERVTKDLSYHTDAPIESLEDIFNDLIRHIVRLGHGGILIFTADPTKDSFSLSRPLNCNYLFRLITRQRHQSPIDPRPILLATTNLRLAVLGRKRLRDVRHSQPWWMPAVPVHHFIALGSPWLRPRGPDRCPTYAKRETTPRSNMAASPLSNDFEVKGMQYSFDLGDRELAFSRHKSRGLACGQPRTSIKLNHAPFTPRKFFPNNLTDALHHRPAQSLPRT